jgi:hypothetical protein
MLMFWKSEFALFFYYLFIVYLQVGYRYKLEMVNVLDKTFRLKQAQCQIHRSNVIFIVLYIQLSQTSQGMHYSNHYLHLKHILTWASKRYLQVPPFFWRRSSPCSDSDLQLGAFLPLIHQCEFSTSFLSLQIKLEFCYEQLIIGSTYKNRSLLIFYLFWNYTSYKENK